MLIEISDTVNPFTKKHMIRTKDIKLTGRGIDLFYTEEETGLYNIYSATKAATKKIKEQHPEYKIY